MPVGSVGGVKCSSPLHWWLLEEVLAPQSLGGVSALKCVGGACLLSGGVGVPASAIDSALAWTSWRL